MTFFSTSILCIFLLKCDKNIILYGQVIILYINDYKHFKNFVILINKTKTKTKTKQKMPVF